VAFSLRRRAVAVKPNLHFVALPLRRSVVAVKKPKKPLFSPPLRAPARHNFASREKLNVGLAGRTRIAQ
jgi:hypothetical protein